MTEKQKKEMQTHSNADFGFKSMKQSSIRKLISDTLDIAMSNEKQRVYFDMVSKIEEKPQDSVIPVIIEMIKECNMTQNLLIFTLLKDMEHLQKLPFLIIEELKQLPNNSRQLYSLLSLYSSLFLTGYFLVVSFDQLLIKFNVDFDAYHDFVDFMTTNFITENSDAIEELGREPFGSIKVDSDISEIEPFSESTPFHSETEAFSSKKVLDIPLKSYLDNLDNYFSDEDKFMEFIKPLGKFTDAFKNLKAKKIAEEISERMYKGKYKGMYKLFYNLEKIEPNNPMIYSMKSNFLKQYNKGPISNNPFFKPYELLKKAIQLSSKSGHPHIEYYFNMSLVLQMLGYFRASYALTLSLLRFLPADPQLHYTAAFSAYQLLLPFKNFLYRAAISDPGRTINFLTQYWHYERFKPQDTFEMLQIEKKEITRLENEVEEYTNLFFSVTNIDIPGPEILGEKFPYKETIGYTPFFVENNSLNIENLIKNALNFDGGGSWDYKEEENDDKINLKESLERYKNFKPKVFQLKISIQGIRPPVWRRILIQNTANFYELHDAIQYYFDWGNYHLHEFTIRNKEMFRGNTVIMGYNPSGEKPEMMSETCFLEDQVQLANFISMEHKRIHYTYDFGDNWDHEIVLEKILPWDSELVYPKCIKGKRATPPEDCGGPWGYERFRDMLKNSEHEEDEEDEEDEDAGYEDFSDWADDEDFDPEFFEIIPPKSKRAKIR
ncbi:MAG: plasmid pRiA4b ORF-3 family protein [Promethearchaeota archaeon]